MQRVGLVLNSHVETTAQKSKTKWALSIIRVPEIALIIFQKLFFLKLLGRLRTMFSRKRSLFEVFECRGRDFFCFCQLFRACSKTDILIVDDGQPKLYWLVAIGNVLFSSKFL